MLDQQTMKIVVPVAGSLVYYNFYHSIQTEFTSKLMTFNYMVSSESARLIWTLIIAAALYYYMK